MEINVDNKPAAADADEERHPDFALYDDGEDHPIGLDVALHEFDRFAELMDLDLRERDDDDDDDRKSLRKQKRRFLKAVRRGQLTVDEHGQPHFTPQADGASELVFREPNGAALMEINRAKAHKTVAQQHNVLAAITKTTSQRFAKMDIRDLKVCNAILAFFMEG